MRILFLARYLPSEGSTTHMYTLSEALTRRGHEVHCVSGGPADNPAARTLLEAAEAVGLTHHRVPFPIKQDVSGRLGRAAILAKYGAALPMTLNTIRRVAPDIIHVHYPVTSFLAAIYRATSNTPFVTTHHAQGTPRHPLHRRADHVIAISDELREELSASLGYRADRIHTIYNGVSEDRFSALAPAEESHLKKIALGLPQDRPIIGFVGSFTHRKGIDILCEACSQLDGDFHLLLVGASRSGEIAYVTKLLEASGLTPRATVLPFQDPVPLYHLMDIFALPSRREGFALVSIEAMMMGVATVRSESGGARAQILHGSTGILFPNQDSNRLRTELRDLLNNVSRRTRIAQAGREYALQNFSAGRMAERTEAVYRTALGA